MAASYKDPLMAALKVVWRRIIRQPLKMVGLLTISIGCLHVCLRYSEWGRKHSALGRGIHGLTGAVGSSKIPSDAELESGQQLPAYRECSNSNRSSLKPRCIARNLSIRGNASNKESVQGEEFGDTSTKSKHYAPFPWPRREKLMPNYLLNLNGAEEVKSTSLNNDVLIFLHHNKAAGTTAKECLRQVVKATDRELGHVLSSEGRLGLLSNLRKLHRRGKRRPDTYFGGYAFGACDELQQPCSYFTVLRDPYTRTLSSHSYCKKARTDQLCTALHAEKTTLREWALHQGSFFFRQLVFHPEFCSDKTKWIPFVDLKGEPHEFEGSKSLEDATCWFRQKLIMSLTLNRTEHDALLQYCLDNLEHWFKVIMLVDEFDLSLAMMELAYKLPFHELCSGSHVNIGSYEKHGNSTNIKLKSNITSPNSSLLNDSIANQIRDLKADPTVQDVLRADMMIYQKGLEIFEKQKDIFLKINHGEKVNADYF
ncbi:uncharacterized protein LOC110986706 [Acanthaster planci]|uniref:Uncharacterized protein LOC110986706 n=1 Tax=Acanthaster planci TaxID=133434 RepID=A0A8B7ZME5_ACAPL|nr:uncharacterized protein LOC110986706 [Acanthaster planci]